MDNNVESNQSDDEWTRNHIIVFNLKSETLTKPYHHGATIKPCRQLQTQRHKTLHHRDNCHDTPPAIDVETTMSNYASSIAQPIRSTTIKPRATCKNKQPINTPLHHCES